MALIECPDCKRQVSDSAPVCPGCGRPVAVAALPTGPTPTIASIAEGSAPTPPQNNGGCIKAILYMALVALVLVAALFGLSFLGVLVGLSGSGSSGSSPSSTVTRTEDAPDARKRMFRQDTASGLDDHVRTRVFSRSIKGAGRRCDSVTSATMQEPGVWLVECAPGYRFRFAFDESGTLQSLRPLP